MNNLTEYRQRFPGRNGKPDTFGPLCFRHLERPELEIGEKKQGVSVEIDYDKGRGIVMDVFEVEFSGVPMSGGVYISATRSWDISGRGGRGNGYKILLMPAQRRSDKTLTAYAERLDATVPLIVKMFGEGKSREDISLVVTDALLAAGVA